MTNQEVISVIIEIEAQYKDCVTSLSKISQYVSDCMDIRLQKLKEQTNTVIGKINKEPEDAFTLLEGYRLKVNTALISLRDYIENNHLEEQLPAGFEINLVDYKNK